VLALSLIAAAAAAPAACPAPLAFEALDANLREAESAWGALDVQRFDGVMDSVALTLPCLEAVVTPSVASRYHLLQGLRLYAAGDERRAELAFAAARWADREATVSLALVPEGHAIHELFVSLPVDGADTEPLPTPRGVRLVLDGTERSVRPNDWPTLFQIEGSEVETVYLLPGEPTPAYPAIDPPVDALPFIKSKPQLVFLGTGAAAAVVAGVFYAVAGASAQTFEEEHADWDRADLEAQQARTNTWVTASGVAGGVAVGGVTLGAISGRW
jgi:hypothetical protein